MEESSPRHIRERWQELEPATRDASSAGPASRKGNTYPSARAERPSSERKLGNCESDSVPSFVSTRLSVPDSGREEKASANIR